jgi:hypothetical protein
MTYDVIFICDKVGALPKNYKHIRVYSAKEDSIEDVVKEVTHDLKDMHKNQCCEVGTPKIILVRNVRTGEIHSVQHIKSLYIYSKN